MTRLEWAQIAAAVSSAFDNRELPKQTMEIYYATLSDLPSQRVRDACLNLVRGNRFFPRVAEIRDEVAVVARQAADRQRSEMAMRGLAEPAPYPPDEQLRINREGIARIKALLERVGEHIDSPKETT